MVGVRLEPRFIGLFSSLSLDKGMEWLNTGVESDRCGFLWPGTLSDLPLGCTVKPATVRHRPGRIPVAYGFPGPAARTFPACETRGLTSALK